MLNSMTGYGSREGEVEALGKVTIELRSSNHKFLDLVLHLPEGFLSWEDKIKKEIESRLKRGRITCNINITPQEARRVFINKPLLKNYINALRNIKSSFGIIDDIRLNTLINLPNVLSLEGSTVAKSSAWPALKILFSQALEGLVKMRQKEGRGLQVYLKNRATALKRNLDYIKARFNKVMKEKVYRLKTDEERTNFLKNADISEETQRLEFHIKNFVHKLPKNGPLGKELDFIAQEMQREANTIGAKSCDTMISSRVVNIKSQIEKIREQLQNIE